MRTKKPTSSSSASAFSRSFLFQAEKARLNAEAEDFGDGSPVAEKQAQAQKLMQRFLGGEDSDEDEQFRDEEMDDMRQLRKGAAAKQSITRPDPGRMKQFNPITQVRIFRLTSR